MSARACLFGLPVSRVFEGGQLLQVVTDRLPQSLQQSPPLDRGQPSPGPGLNGHTGRPHSGIDVSHGAGRNLRKNPAVRRAITSMVRPLTAGCHELLMKTPFAAAGVTDAPTRAITVMKLPPNTIRAAGALLCPRLHFLATSIEFVRRADVPAAHA